jgi:uncharacterized protein YkwD
MPLPHCPMRSLVRTPWCAVLAAVLVPLTACGGGTGGDGGGGGTTAGAPVNTSTPAATPPSGVALISTTCQPGVTPAQAIAQINEIRAVPRMCGSTSFPAAPPLQWNEALGRAAGAHAADMASKNYFSHDGQDGSTAASRAQAAGYAWTWIGENISAGRSTMEIALADWLQSPGHCANLMRADYTDYGIGCAYDAGSQYKTYWAQSFGAQR